MSRTKLLLAIAAVFGLCFWLGLCIVNLLDGVTGAAW